MSYKLESRYADDTTLTAESEEELKSLLMKVTEESEEAGFKVKLGYGTSLIRFLSGILIYWSILFWGAPKSQQMVTAAMKLKDTCSLEEKL